MPTHVPTLTRRRIATARTSIALLAIVAGTLIAAGMPAEPAAEDGPVIQLPAKGRTVIDRYLGSGVVGVPVPAPLLRDATEFLDFEDGLVQKFRVVHGRMKGQSGQAELRKVSRTDPSIPKWRFDTGMNEVLYGRVGPDGSLEVTSSENHDQGVLTRYDPPEPIIINGMKPGQTIERRINVSVFDLAAPGKKKHSGQLDLDYTYLGAYKVTVPAGTFDAVLLRWRYLGKVGPANVRDEQYWFMAPGVGPVAMIQKTDVSALLVYQDHSKTAGVLLERTKR